MTKWVQRLLFANIAMFFLQQTVGGLTQSLQFVPVYVLVRPWTIITYMFLHGGFMHILFNMIGLYFFGPRLEAQLGSGRFFTLYMLAGVCGGIASVFLAPTSPIIGASAAVYGVMLGYAMLWPTDEILIWGLVPVQIRWLVIFVTGFSLFGGFTGADAGTAHFAHLGGFAGAYVYMKWLQARRGMAKFHKKAAPSIPDRALNNWRNVDTKGIHEINREEVNRILDKINATGIGSLTPQEKIFLSNFVPLDDRKPPVA